MYSVPTGARRVHGIWWDRSYRWSLATMWVLGTKLTRIAVNTKTSLGSSTKPYILIDGNTEFKCASIKHKKVILHFKSSVTMKLLKYIIISNWNNMFFRKEQIFQTFLKKKSWLVKTIDFRNNFPIILSIDNYLVISDKLEVIYRKIICSVNLLNL